jgi:hypothetical protein
MRLIVLAALLCAIGLGAAAQGVAPPVGGPTSSLPVVFPESFGALGNGVKTFDGAVTGAGTFASANNSGTALNAPAVTTVNANDWVLSIFANGVAYATAPSPANTRESISFAATEYGLLVGDQPVARPGTVSAVTSTLNSATGSAAASIALQPADGQTISFVAGSTFSHNNGAKATITLTKPTGAASGDYLVACFAHYQITGHIVNLVPVNTSGWSMILDQSNSLDPNLMCLGRFATASEPSSYLFQLNSGQLTGQNAIIVDYRGTSGVEAMNQTITSATADFVSADQGYPICVAGEFGFNTNSLTNAAYSYPQQVCGTITAVKSPTSISTSFYLPYTQTGLPIAFGHDDTANFAAMLTTAPCSAIGCQVQLGMKHYIITGGLTIGQNEAININGSGAALPNTTNNLRGGTAPPLANYTGGSTITMLSRGANNALLTIGSPTAANTSTVTTSKFSNFALIGGVGNYSDGGGYNASTNLGTDCMDVFSYQLLEFSHVMMANCAGNGLYIDGVTGDSGYSFDENISFNNGYIGMNGLSGVLVGSSGIAINIEPIDIRESVIEGNGAAGVTMASTVIYGFWFSGNTIQWDNTMNASGNEFNITGRVYGGFADGNYFETDSNYGSYSTHLVSSTSGAAGFQIGTQEGSGNFFVGNGTWYYGPSNPMPVFSAAGTALPASTGITIGERAMVSDSTACTAGTTYTSGGSTQCVVISNGTNWIETGAAY